MGFSQGLSGLNAASQALDVVGNNIANSQTVGFKSGAIAFADVFAGSQVGMGVQVAGVNQNFSGGILAQGNGALDMGIQGNGFFRLVNDAGKVYYSRNGQFKTNENGFIINNQNMMLTGYQATGTPPAIIPGSPLGPIKIPGGQMPASASTTGTMSGNLNSSEEIKDPLQFDPAKGDSYNYMSQVDAYDSLGNKHTVNVYYVKTADNQWTAFSSDSSAPVTEPGTGEVVYNQLDLQFDSNGALTTDPATLNVKSSSLNGGNPLDLALDLTGMSQQSADSEMTSPSTNGYPPGQMNGYLVGDNGQVEASYSNGQKQLIAQVVLSSFTNTGGLSSEGNNCWSETPQSGQPVNGISGSGNLGMLFGNRLEASNVDLGQEMVNMIVYQRNYQSNSQTIKTQSELLQTLANLR